MEGKTVYVVALAILLVTLELSCVETRAVRQQTVSPTLGSTTKRPEPVAAKTRHPRIVQVTAGLSHTCVLTDIGTVRCWGSGANGQLGYGNTKTIGDDEPAGAGGDVDLGGRAVQISAGDEHTCAVLEDRSARCWGKGRHGRLGYGNENDIGDDETPRQMGPVPVGVPLAKIQTGSDETCGITANGKMRCWGEGGENGLGYGDEDSVGDDEFPKERGDILMGAPVVSVALIGSGCALLTTGGVRCWGAIFGRDDERYKILPYMHEDVHLSAKATQISGWYDHVCVVLEDGGVQCWGGGTSVLGEDNFYIKPYPFQSAHESPGIRTPRQVGYLDVGGKAREVAAGSSHVCVLLTTGAVRCWGEGRFGVLGYGNTESYGEDTPPGSGGDVPIGEKVVSIAAGGFHTCAIITSGAIRCWGVGKDGPLGYGNTENVGDKKTPADVGDVPVF